jgi:hypothetical protein
MEDSHWNTIPGEIFGVYLLNPLDSAESSHPDPCPDASGRIRFGMVREFSSFMVTPASGMGDCFGRIMISQRRDKDKCYCIKCILFSPHGGGKWEGEERRKEEA